MSVGAVGVEAVDVEAVDVGAVDVVAGVLLVIGALLTLAAGVGLVRFPDALSRMHAAAKPQVLGLICVLLAVALESGSWLTLLFIAPIVVLQLITTPMAAHMIGRAGYRTKNYRRSLIVSDELQDDIDRAQS
ncbi:monovalent cation/H(+) antiporter subunit G [Naasia lichenicola]|uniref:Monovalent cation/H(+) antiporter subunit G n=1 Tax=Naasia lichenicola TaxID=2565933 RepID=A0A4S4FNK8_9MICO|nr:monovalent cation/H(+) antiporter subunit G [Naasia lichenicola]THG31831.1 monovalent cation/H(+) antiporter subunit G [Naasia lichenicola]